MDLSENGGKTTKAPWLTTSFPTNKTVIPWTSPVSDTPRFATCIKPWVRQSCPGPWPKRSPWSLAPIVLSSVYSWSPMFYEKAAGGNVTSKKVASVPWRVVRRPKKIKEPTFGHHLLGNPNPQATQHQPMRHEVDMLPGCLSISFCIALVQNHDLATGSSVIWTWAPPCRTLDGCAAPVP